MDRLKALLQDANIWCEDFEEEFTDIERSCELRKVFAKTPSRPVVAFPMARDFNEIVAMDLKQYKDQWILHMVDMWSRYSVSVLINRKKTSIVIDALMTNWVGIFGVMKALMTDNGDEFTSDELREVASILSIQVGTTAAFSPYRNGLCERVHAITDHKLMKLEVENSDVDLETLLFWANMAKNSLQMRNGYSSHQPVFGRNP
uniref:Integrase catalytic domain-containing protein n=1 Tax=Biomphalaria glabrata TaxID=6526 RepID=A0A2C9L444_BIOGL